MEFKVIPDEQTPAVPKIVVRDGKKYIKEHIKELQTFLDFAKTRKYALGLAANQCAIFGDNSEDGVRFTLPVFAIYSISKNEWRLIINPTINRCFGIKEIKVEGCLTWEKKRIVAERYRQIDVNYFDFNGEFHQGEIIKGLDAEIWQHEVNHLEGVEENVVDYFVEPPPIEVGRNEPCPCGSGKKYKKCCQILDKYN